MKKIAIILLILAIVGMVLGIGIYSYYDGQVNTELIYEGVSIDGVDMSNMTVAEATTILNKHIGDKSNRDMELVYGDLHFTFPYAVLGYTADVKTAVDTAYGIGREGSAISRLAKVISLKGSGEDVELVEKLDPIKVDEALDTLAQDINRDPVDAKLVIVNGLKQIEKEQDGLKLNPAASKVSIMENIATNEKVTLSVEHTEAAVKENSFDEITGVIASFSTDYSSSIQNRKENIAISTSKISGHMVMPGQVFSFNDAIGAIDEASGYKPASVIINGEFDSGVGGGVCQVSTTLYNAITKADLEIVERRNHSRPVGYVKRGTDAAVAIGLLDLKFKNNHDFPLYIYGETNGNEVTFSIFGKVEAMDYDIEMESELVETITKKTQEKYDGSLEPGAYIVEQKGNDGYRYKTYKVKKKDGEVISRELYSTDYYPVRNTIVKVGPKIEAPADVE